MAKKKTKIVEDKTLPNKNVEKPKMVNLFKTTYYYYRFWVRDIMENGKVNGFRFIKDELGWTGCISIPNSETDKANKVLSDYKAKNPDIVDMWW